MQATTLRLSSTEERKTCEADPEQPTEVQEQSVLRDDSGNESETVDKDKIGTNLRSADLKSSSGKKKSKAVKNDNALLSPVENKAKVSDVGGKDNNSSDDVFAAIDKKRGGSSQASLWRCQREPSAPL